jgi:aryl-alcohol dehydrogenase-like predicted oxidoreductase
MHEVSGSLPISRRPIPGTNLSASRLGFSIEPAEGLTPTGEERSVALLRAARKCGVTTFRIPDGAGARRAVRLVAAALPASDPEVVVVLAHSFTSLANEGARDMAGGAAADFEGRLRQSLQTASTRLAPHRVDLLEWSHESDSGLELSEVREVLDRLRTEGHFQAVSMRLSADEVDTAGTVETPAAPRLLSGDLSALDHRHLTYLDRAAATGSLGFFALDPLSSGRLDGSRFAAAIGNRHPDAPPVSVRELRKDAQPVLRLGFLTEGHRRTLAQASLQFLFHWTWVCSALVPLPSPERLDELVAVERSAPLSESEVEAVLELA